MQRVLAVAAFLLVLASASNAQTFEKKNFNYSKFAKGAFSEVVTVTGPAKMIYLAGIGSEDEDDGSVRHKDDFLAQCRFAWEKIGKLLQGARRDRLRHRQGDDLRHRHPLSRRDAQAAAPKCSRAGRCRRTRCSTSCSCARPGMMFEVDVVAAVAAK